MALGHQTRTQIINRGDLFWIPDIFKCLWILFKYLLGHTRRQNLKCVIYVVSVFLLGREGGGGRQVIIPLLRPRGALGCLRCWLQCTVGSTSGTLLRYFHQFLCIECCDTHLVCLCCLFRVLFLLLVLDVHLRMLLCYLCLDFGRVFVSLHVFGPPWA